MKSKQPKLTWKGFRQLVAFVRPYWGWVVLNMVVTLVSAIVDMSGGYFIKNITDFALNNRPQDIVKTVYLIIAVIIVGIIMKYGVKYTSGRFSAYAVRDIRTSSVRAVESIPFSIIETSHSGDMVSRFTNDAYVVQNFFLNSFSNLFYQPIIFVTTFLYMLTLNARLLVWAMIVIPVMLFFTTILSRPLGGFIKQSQEGRGKMNAVIQDTIGGIYMQKAFNLERVLYEKFKVAVNQVRDNMLRYEKRLAVMTTLFVIIRTLPVLSTAAYGGYLTMKGQATPGSIFAFVYLLHFLIEPLRIVPELITELRAVSATADRIMEIIRHPGERTDGQSFAADPTQALIECANVSFAYNQQTDVLKNMSLCIPHQKMVALVGHSGSGKSTVFKLLCGFYEPQEGRVKLYGHDLSAWKLEALRRQLSLVSQDTYLFPATVAENISYGRPGATMDDIVEAAKAARAHEFIMDLPKGYETMVGERGNRLSGGQRQRIEIARAILKDAPILLLDEPTSALDVHSEALVQEALEQFMRGRTVLVIAHRLSTIKRADEILVLDRGCIVERGTHQELLDQAGLYKQLYLKQFQADESKSL